MTGYPTPPESVPPQGVVWGIIIALMGCTASTVEEPAKAEWLVPGEYGPHTVATRTDTITGSDGLELVVQTWYPTQQESGPYHTYDDIFDAPNVLDQAEADCTEIRPVLAFSHGDTAISYQSIFLTEYLASRGWVIVAPDHRGNTLFEPEEHRIALALRRPIDIRDTVDWLFDSLGAANGELSGCIDPDDGYAVSGHSFGGYTTLATAGAVVDLTQALEFCETQNEWMCGSVSDWISNGHEAQRIDLSDERVWAAMPMAHAGHEVLHSGLDQIDIPMLVLGGGQDPGTTMERQIQPTYDGLISAEPRYLGEIERAGHFAFSDACTLLSGFVGDECTDAYVDPEEGHHIIRTWASAFLQQARGQTNLADYLPGDFDGVRWEAHGLSD